MTTLEQLPNELLQNIFRFLTLNDILRAFYRLNKRFNNLIIDNHKWKANIITDDDYNILRERDFAIQLNSPNLLELIMFVSLQILILHRIDCLNTLETVLKQCNKLENLTCLKIIEPFDKNANGNSLTWINHVWNPPKLTHFYLHDRRHKSKLPKQDGIISSTIEHIYFDIDLNSIELLDYVLQYTPNRRTFKLHNLSCACKTNFTFDLSIKTLKCLKMVVGTSIKPFERVLERLPNLEILKLDINCKAIHYNLGDIIERNVPHLKDIQLHMVFHFMSTVNKQKEVDTLLDNFRSSFWMNKNLYFRCIWYESTIEEQGLCYTSPRLIQDFSNKKSFRFASTCLEEEIYTRFTDHIKTFRYYDEKNVLPNGAHSFYSNISNVHKLDIDLPFQEDIFSDFVSKLEQTLILDVKMTYNSTYDQLKDLINRMPRLNSLIIQYRTDLPIKSESFNFNHQTIRQLKLLNQAMDESDCIALYNSPLAKQIERLSITLQDYKIVLKFIQEMPKLQLLIFWRKTNKVELKKSASTDAEMVQWLNANLSELYMFKNLLFRNFT